MTLARIREFLREPEAVFWVFVFPILLAVALGLAFREKAPEQIPVGVVSTPDASATEAALGRSEALKVLVLPREEAREALRTGRISLLVERDEGSAAGVVFSFDETRPDARAARLEVVDALERAAGRTDRIAVREQKLSEPGARYIDFLIPGLLGLNLMGTGVWSVAFGITAARQRKILKRLIATPMHKGDYLAAQILGRLLFLVPEAVVLIGFGWIAFDVAIRGSIVLYAAVCLVGAISFCGLGLLVAARTRTFEGASGLANLVLLPMWVLSGTFFSSERFPKVVKPWIDALPLTALNDALRAVGNQGAGFSEVWMQLGIVAAWGVASFALALALFRWK